jgi:hypothetical protein
MRSAVAGKPNDSDVFSRPKSESANPDLLT